MFGLESLDVLIGLVTVYLVLALACTAIVEAIAAWLEVRSKHLEAALKEFFAGELKEKKKFIEAFYAHPLVQALSSDEDKKRLPSYIPPEVVGQVLQALITASGTEPSLKVAVDKLPGSVEDNRIKGLLSVLVTQANGDAAAFRKAVETHFDAVMDRASGQVKRRQQNVALAVSFVLVCLANVDTFTLATALSSSPELRAKMVALAEQQLKEDQPAAAKKEEATPNTKSDNERMPSEDALKIAKQKSEEAFKDYNRARVALETGGLQFGWKNPKDNTAMSFEKIIDELSLAKIVGLLITILAVSLGAPFWFDVLQRLMKLRQTGISPREKKEEKLGTP